MTRTTFSTCSGEVLPTSVQTGAKQSASTRSPSSSEASTSRRRVMPKAAISLERQPLAREQLEELLLLGVRGREAGLDQVDAELVEPAGRRAASPAAVRVMPPPPIPSRRVAS